MPYNKPNPHAIPPIPGVRDLWTLMHVLVHDREAIEAYIARIETSRKELNETLEKMGLGENAQDAVDAAEKVLRDAKAETDKLRKAAADEARDILAKARKREEDAGRKEEELRLKLEEATRREAMYKDANAKADERERMLKEETLELEADYRKKDQELQAREKVIAEKEAILEKLRGV